MQYFNTLPKLIYTDENGTSSLRVNLLARARIIPELLKNPLVYYTYDIQEGDTPEIIAYKYYGDSYLYWVVLLANEIIDPQWEWPLNGNQFMSYLQEKYGEQNIYSEIHHYEKIITQFDETTKITTTTNITIDEDTYNSLVETSNTYTLPTGPVSVAVKKKAVTVYEYESLLNESKRNIKILNSLYVDQLQTEFRNLMSKQYV